MLNNVVIVGRLTKDPVVVKSESGNSRTFTVIAVPRTYKNANGEYEADFIKCILWNAMAEHTCEYCKKGDIVGIKGRLESRTYEKDGETRYDTEIIAERISFLSAKNIKDNIVLDNPEA